MLIATGKETRVLESAASRIDKVLLSARVGEILGEHYLSISSATTIQNAARAMTKSRVTVAVVVDETDFPVGIVTDREFREKVVARGSLLSCSVSDIMRPLLVRADADEYCYETLLKMIRHGLHHLPVIENGCFRGIVTSDDMVFMQSDSPFSFARDIELQQTEEGLRELSRRLTTVVSFLVREGAQSSTAAGIVSRLWDRLVSRVLLLAEKRFGLPPVQYSWIAFGSDGRREQLMGGVSGNGIIYADSPQVPGQAGPESYFTAMISYVRDVLVQCNPFPVNDRKEEVLFGSGAGPLSRWKEQFAEWILELNDRNIMKSLDFLDMRYIAGDAGIAEALRHHASMLVQSHYDFLSRMAILIARAGSVSGPAGAFRRRKQSNALQDRTAIYTYGFEPLVNAVRLLALALSVLSTSTVERLADIKKKDPGVSRQCDLMVEAYERFAAALVVCTASTAAREKTGLIPAMRQLSEMERTRLAESVDAVQGILESIADHYRLRIVGV